MKLVKLLNDYIKSIQAVETQQELHTLLKKFIDDIHLHIPELSYYEGKGNSTAEVQCRAGSNFYGKQYTTEHIRALNGALCHLLSLAGTPIAYEAFIRGQHTLNNLPVLPFGQEQDLLSEGDCSFLGYHNFINRWPLEQHAGIFYTGAINDLGKQDLIKSLYKKIIGNNPTDHDIALGVVLEASLNNDNKKLFDQENIFFPTLNAFDSMTKEWIFSSFQQSCTNSQLQQCEATEQQVMDLKNTSILARIFHYLMEYCSDVPGARVPKDGLATSLTMHQQTMEHIYLLWKNFFVAEGDLIEHGDLNDLFDFKQAYDNYRNARLLCADISPKVMALIIGSLRIGDGRRSPAAISAYCNMPEHYRNILNHQWERQSIYMLNIVAQLNNAIYKTGNIEAGLTVGLCLAAYLYEMAEQHTDLSDTHEQCFINATHVANQIGFGKETANKDQILEMYYLLQSGQKVPEALEEVLHCELIMETRKGYANFIVKPVELPCSFMPLKESIGSQQENNPTLESEIKGDPSKNMVKASY